MATKILVVDDDELLRDFYVRVLSAMGYQTASATNGDEAIEVLNKNEGEPFALGIIDLLMPVRTGWELIQYIRGQEKIKDMPIIAVTGMSASLEEREKVEKMCNAILLKSEFDLDKFLRTVGGLLKKK